jgi:DNA-binding MarR family transcriptional regulator
MSKIDEAYQRIAAGLDVDRMLALFFMAWRGFASEPDGILERDGLGRVHHRVLYTVVRLPGATVGDLAATLGVTRQALHRPMADLTKRRLVVVRVSKRSGRERAVFATDRGARLEDQASGAQRDQLTRVFDRLGPEARRAWCEVMYALAAPVISRSPGLVGRIVEGG